MGSPRNWERRKFIENDVIPFAWENTENGRYLIIIGQSGHYEIYVVGEQVNSFTADNLERNSVQLPINGHTVWGSKNRARSAAVSWMEAHPTG